MHPTLTTVLERISVREGCDPTALPPLYEAVDPEAATSLLESSTDIVVRFDYVGYRVAIGPDSHEVTVIGEVQ
ncbi:HalOD1 output domain-containing protein [Natrinema sp. 74]|uniref:HalOD1 output domain-containing protein n=1 Tax=Natrinema sp. 74 TaxID=3384159 RepID=UPI0038D4BAC7